MEMFGYRNEEEKAVGKSFMQLLDKLKQANTSIIDECEFKSISYITMKQVTAAVIILNKKVLLTRRKHGEALSGYWEFPGGKIEEGETPQACLERELKEELNLNTRAGLILAKSEYHYAHGAFKILALLTEILDNGDFTLSVHDKAEWVDLDDLLNYKLAPADIPIANKIKALFNAA